jgi:hypothetical protein
MPAARRHLSEYEIRDLPAGFTRSFDIRAVELIDRPHNPFAKNKILCRGPRLYWQDHPQDFTRKGLIIKSLLVHELCHVWQYETGRLTAFSYLINPRNWVYAYEVRAGAKFDDYPTEKQADLLQDWYLVNMGAKPVRYDPKGATPTQHWLNEIVPFEWKSPRALETGAEQTV